MAKAPNKPKSQAPAFVNLHGQPIDLRALKRAFMQAGDAAYGAAPKPVAKPAPKPTVVLTPADLTEAVEGLVRATLLLADVGRPLPNILTGAAPRRPNPRPRGPRR